MDAPISAPLDGNREPRNPKKRQRLDRSEGEEDGYQSDCESTISNMTLEEDVEDTIPVQTPTKPDEYQAKTTQALDVEEAADGLFLNELYSDFKIVCGDSVFPAHKFIVCSQSEYFTCTFRGNFIEKQEGTITIMDEKPKTIYRMLEFLYSGIYHNGPTGDENDEDVSYKFATKVNFTMYRIADKYGIPGLARYATRSQRSDFINLIPCPPLWEEEIWATRKCYKFFQGRYDAMRMTHLDMLSRCLGNCSGEDIWKNEALGVLCKENPDLTYDLMVFLQWEKEFPDDETAAVSGGDRPHVMVRNLKGGWDTIFGWGPRIEGEISK